jgi:hypothetical protein
VLPRMTVWSEHLVERATQLVARERWEH